MYAKFGVEIYVVAKKGEPDPELNTALRFVIDRAKQSAGAKHVIDKAIDKGKRTSDETLCQKDVTKDLTKRFDVGSLIL